MTIWNRRDTRNTVDEDLIWMNGNQCGCGNFSIRHTVKNAFIVPDDDPPSELLRDFHKSD